MDVNEAVKKAVSFATSLPNLPGNGDITLEEVQLAEGYWRITLGFRRELPTTATQQALGQPRKYEIAYKVVSILDATGEVESMKIRELAA